MNFITKLHRRRYITIHELSDDPSKPWLHEYFWYSNMISEFSTAVQIQYWCMTSELKVPTCFCPNMICLSMYSVSLFLNIYLNPPPQNNVSTTLRLENENLSIKRNLLTLLTSSVVCLQNGRTNKC